MGEGKKATWFPAKTNGWGWGKPSSWQGWLVWALYLLAVVMVSVIFDPKIALFKWAIGVGVSTLILLIIYCVKGDAPSWKWKRIERKKHRLFK